ncbi:lipoprotein, YaeC family [Candidatus Regiella insecticola 5.15]|uniref:Lipoprotein n=1 Tax=Candidatus Regiella insecticola 5.15 TaxID=1005043 RepID=G2H1A1_9ENTR|nr:MetQ/NlpA family lipoprotein [Candidatus Regiella insecticola]EGY28237.1 lipoprotein, YaeC family [Candidatus Regiella insecticola 5.15]
MFIKSIAVISALLGSLIIAGCDSKEPSDVKEPNDIKVGIVVGAEKQLAEVAKKVAKEKYNLDVTLVDFTDYVLPNEVLNKGEIDVNAFQHEPYLEQQIKDRGYKLAPVGKTFIYPIAAYSKKIKSPDESQIAEATNDSTNKKPLDELLQPGSQIAVANDPTNLGRSLLLLQKEGLIKLKEGVGLLPTVLDIVENPKELKLVELDAPQLPHSLDDQQITLAIINNTYASQIGLSPAKDGLFVEDTSSPYVNLIVAREDNKDADNVKKFVQAYQSEEVIEAANQIFNGGAVKGW